MLSARGSDQLRAVALAMKLIERDVRNAINRATRQTMTPVWRDAVAANARTGLDRRVVATGVRIAAGNPPALVAATSKRALRGGLVPVETWQAVEFGADREKVTTYSRRSPKGTQHQVTRHTARQMPQRRRGGRVAYPAVKQFAPRLAALWVQIVVRQIHEAAERGA